MDRSGYPECTDGYSNLIAVLLLSNVIVKETKKYINDLDARDDTPVEVIDK